MCWFVTNMYPTATGGMIYFGNIPSDCRGQYDLGLDSHFFFSFFFFLFSFFFSESIHLWNETAIVRLVRLSNYMRHRSSSRNKIQAVAALELYDGLVPRLQYRDLLP